MNALCQKCKTTQNLHHDWLKGEAILRCDGCAQRNWEGECAYKDRLVIRTKAKSAWVKYGEQVAKIQLELDAATDRDTQCKLRTKLAEVQRKQAAAEEEIR